jgi:hypothetical protein
MNNDILELLPLHELTDETLVLLDTENASDAEDIKQELCRRELCYNGE